MARAKCSRTTEKQIPYTVNRDRARWPGDGMRSDGAKP